MTVAPSKSYAKGLDHYSQPVNFYNFSIFRSKCHGKGIGQDNPKKDDGVGCLMYPIHFVMRYFKFRKLASNKVPIMVLKFHEDIKSIHVDTVVEQTRQLKLLKGSFQQQLNVFF